MGHNVSVEYVPPKRLLAFNRLHNIISQKTELFIITALITSKSASTVLIDKLREMEWTVSGFCRFKTWRDATEPILYITWYTTGPFRIWC
jgi:hypothetical protein